MNEYAIEVKNVSKVINGKRILNNINFNVKKNSIVGLVGPNGAGKSTLLKIMTGLYTLDVGEVIYEGVSLKNDFEKAMEKVGCIIENPDMYKNLSGNDNLELFKVMFKGINEETIRGIVKIVNLEKSIGKKFKTYSLGMKERLGIASSLLGNPRILILDEPTNGLDPIGIKNLRSLLTNLKDTTIIISSHLLSEIENICNEVIFINNGEIIERKDININSDKKHILFEVDDYFKAKDLIEDFSIGESLYIYATDEEIYNINKKLILNNIKVYRIEEKNNSLEKDFFEKLGINNDEIN
jgi:ABC-2 type transport system ATP-binding protein